MEPEALRRLLGEVRAGRLGIEDAVSRLRALPYEDLGVAKVDHHRALRCGFPEVIYAPGKTAADLARIARRVVRAGNDLLVTRADPSAARAVRRVVPAARYHRRARLVVARSRRRSRPVGHVLVVTAGTGDVPVAEEARVTAETMGSRVETLYDVGVAGLHRLLGSTTALQAARVVVVVAGMEGALASVVGGLVARPVIAVPTSVGYGVSFGGLAALLAMLNACAPNVTAVNVDNGFGAGYVAHLVNVTPAADAGGEG